MHGIAHGIPISVVPFHGPDGAAPPFAWTLQPGGARFDPPVRIKYPNTSALTPGAISNVLSFNHDTGKFEIVSSGRVSADGASIDSDPGSGIAVAGWGGNCPPYSVTEDVKNCNFQLNAVDANFAPSVERLRIKYTILPLAAHSSKLEIFKDGGASPVFTDEWNTAGGSNLDYMQDGLPGRDGIATRSEMFRQYVKPCSYTAKVTIVSTNNEPLEGCSGSRPFKVEVESMNLLRITPTVDPIPDKIIMNDPDNKQAMEATIFLKKKDGTGAATEVPIDVHWSFRDPNDDNTLREDSYHYGFLARLYRVTALKEKYPL